MRHPLYRVESVEQVGPYTLRVGFDDSSTRTINFEPILEGKIYSPLRDPAVFAQVRIDPEIYTLVWPCGADFDPATLHDWPEYEQELKAVAKRWRDSHVAA